MRKCPGDETKSICALRHPYHRGPWIQAIDPWECSGYWTGSFKARCALPTNAFDFASPLEQCARHPWTKNTTCLYPVKNTCKPWLAPDQHAHIKWYPGDKAEFATTSMARPHMALAGCSWHGRICRLGVLGYRGGWCRKIACENDVSSKAYELGMVKKIRPKVVLWWVLWTCAWAGVRWTVRLGSFLILFGCSFGWKRRFSLPWARAAQELQCTGNFGYVTWFTTKRGFTSTNLQRVSKVFQRMVRNGIFSVIKRLPRFESVMSSWRCFAGGYPDVLPLTNTWSDWLTGWLTPTPIDWLRTDWLTE